MAVRPDGADAAEAWAQVSAAPTELELRALIRPIVQACPFEKLAEVWGLIEADYGAMGQRALAREDRYYLLTVLCGRVDAVHPWLYARCREVEADPDGHLDLWAREHYKSTMITFAGAIQEILRDPEITIGIFSHTKPIAKKFMLQIKEELERNTKLITLFPEILWANPEKDSPRWSIESGIVVNRKTNPKEGTVEAWGLVDGQPVGAHYALRVYDDVVTLASVSTPEQVTKTTAAWELSDNLGARGEDGMMRAWHIGTRYSYADTYQELLKRGLKPRIYPATDDGTVSGKPVFLTQEAWDDKVRKTVGPTLACQQLQNPAAGNEALFKAPWLRFADIRPATLNVYIMCDPASSHKKGSDSTAMPVVGIDAGRNAYLLDGYHHKMGLTERWVRMRDLRRKWMAEPGVQSVYVGYERYGMRDSMEYFEQRMEIEGDAFPIVELAWPTDGTAGAKYDRIQRLEPMFRGGRFYIPAVIDGETTNQRKVREAGEEWRILRPTRRVDQTGKAYSLNKSLLTEYLVYPFSPHDDFLDALSRIYDMDMRPPVIVDESALEPPKGTQ